MQVEDGLAGGFAGVDADIEAVRLVFFLDGCPGGAQGFGQRLLFFRGGFEPVGNVAAGNQQRVAGADWVFVPQAQDQVGLEENLVGVRGAEWAGHGNEKVQGPRFKGKDRFPAYGGVRRFISVLEILAVCLR